MYNLRYEATEKTRSYQEERPAHQLTVIYSRYIKLPIFIYLFVCLFLGPHLWHMEIPRLGIQSELQLPAYATAMPGQSRVCDLRYSSQQCQILNSLARPRWNLRPHGS